MTTDKTPGTNYNLDAGAYLAQHAGQTMTKEQHDRYVELRGRPATDTGRKLRKRTASSPED